MNRQILYLFKKLIGFALVAFFGYAILLYTFGNLLSNRNTPNLLYKTGHNYLRLQEVKKTTDVDILFLGSSHAYRGFDTRIFKASGYKVFNLGSSSQTPIQTEIVLNRYLKQLNPKLVVFEVNPGFFTSDGVESSLDLIANDYNDLNTFKMALEQTNTKVYNTFLYAIGERLFGDTPNLKLETYHKGGYVSRDSLTYNENHISVDSKIEIKDKQLRAFKNILQRFKNNKIDYILVQAPITKQRYQSYTNIAEFNTQMKIYGDYYDFNSHLKLSDTLDFYDAHHLNQNGVTIFNTAFLELLEKNYFHKLNDPIK
jgi:hypothetical protein